MQPQEPWENNNQPNEQAPVNSTNGSQSWPQQEPAQPEPVQAQPGGTQTPAWQQNIVPQPQRQSELAQFAAPTQSPADVQQVPQPAPVMNPASFFQPTAPQPFVPPAANSPVAGSLAPSVTSQSTKSHRGLVAAIVAVVVVLAAGGTGFALWQKSQNTPDKVFAAAVNNMFSTKSVTQLIKVKEGTSAAAKFNLADPKNPEVSTVGEVTESGGTVKIQTFGTLQNGYISFTSFGDSTTDSMMKPLLGKWVQIRKDNKLIGDADPATSVGTDPYYMAFGHFVFGNFNAQDRATLTNYVFTNHIYKYDPKSVSTDTVDGHKAYVYNVTEDATKLKELNQKAATMMGLKSSDIQAVLDHLKGSSAKVYVDANSKEFVQVELSQDGENVTDTYAGYNATALLAEPKTSMTWTQFEDKMMNIPLISANQQMSKDLERQDDINELLSAVENAWGNNTGHYPTLAQMNDAQWRAQNVEGMDNAFKDPDGSSTQLASKPTKNMYAYQPTDSSGKPCTVQSKCVHFTLTAILSDGKKYQKSDKI